ncbi:serine/threonine-protein kinase [Parahaliea aestuarii]|uniref:Serine/threonine protein kinase n=1 Tax=Parahaliea aestuarii TaxID=1852021 RepID=A0A5C8ZPM3_9GAMM|nr:serine/threonine-protein kinase [Parahaliea aestuarii]TXS89321.1 serine/threonine protein kinase [Parahaliea aestuarii]
MVDQSNNKTGDAPTETGGDATEVGNTEPAGQGTVTGAATSTGFDRAAEMAREAQSQQGRLLNGRFVLEDILGRGGMGLVYKAQDLRKVEAEDRNPYIAVKVLGQQFSQHPRAFVSLQQEAVKSQKLAHPNIVTVHDFDREGDTIYMTMELLKGDPLDALLKLEAPFSKEVAFRYFRDLCSGLEYAHKRDLVHSDFKPGNIFVTTGGTVKILDFGIARAANKNALSHEFDAGELGALTPAYATVEMVRGEPPRFSDDIYALACVLYVMLTGEHPFQRKSAAEARELGLKPARPEGLNNQEWQVLAAALSFDPAKRPATIAAFRDALIPPRKGSAKAAIAAVVVLALVAGGGIGWQQYRAGQAQQETIQSRLKAAQDCFFSGDFACASENALVARNLAPDNPEAERLLSAARKEQAERQAVAQVEGRLQEARDCLDAGDFACARVKAREVLALQAGEPRAEALLERAERGSRQLQIDGIVARAEACLGEGDLECALESADEAEAAGASSADLYPLRQQVEQRQAQLQAEQAALQEQVAALQQEAEDCLQASRFDCVVERADALLALDAGNTRAVELKQASASALAQAQMNQRTADTLLDAARDCLAARNYSCTIAKSESALAIVPGYGPARELVQQAESAQSAAKRKISIE